jgi:hypothetical protein
MAKDKQAPVTTEPRTQRAWSLRRHGGMWLYEQADIPEDVFRRYVTEEHEDLFGMCASKLEVDMARLRERD